jgi:hypothetical protein
MNKWRGCCDGQSCGRKKPAKPWLRCSAAQPFRNHGCATIPQPPRNRDEMALGTIRNHLLHRGATTTTSPIGTGCGCGEAICVSSRAEHGSLFCQSNNKPAEGWAFNHERISTDLQPPGAATFT